MTPTMPARRGNRWIFADGTTLPVVAGGDGDDGAAGGAGGEGGSGGTPPPGSTEPPKGEGKFTQEDLDRIAGKSREDGRAAYEKELLKSLGVDSVDAAKEALEAHRAAEDANKTDLERVTAERDRAVQEAEATKAEATRIIAVTRMEGALRDAGINPERLPAALKLVDLGALTVEGTEVSGVSEAVESVKESSPEWFGTKGSGGAPDASTHQGGQGADYRTAPKDEVDRRLRELGIRPR